ncbi:MAG: hypothetical protein IJF40_06910 [Clostridia bacterium]|nr:hypothetical protein [Clostridia bacterium]MBQ7047201.1 hypothetical protein [Oscillospiraceae bacterium]
MFFSFGRKTNGYDDDAEYYDEDGFLVETPYDMCDSAVVPDFNAYKSSKTKSKIKQIKENSRKQ